MKRTGMVSLAFVLVAGALVAPADAGRRAPKKVTREAVGTYDHPSPGSASTKAVCSPCGTFQISGSERWVRMEVVDDMSQNPVAFSIYQNKDGDNFFERVGGPFCGSTGKEPVEITPGEYVGFNIYAFGDVVCPGAIATTGTVTAVFSNVP